MPYESRLALCLLSDLVGARGNHQSAADDPSGSEIVQQGQHLNRRCKLWAPTWQKQVGWALEAG